MRYQQGVGNLLRYIERPSCTVPPANGSISGTCWYMYVRSTTACCSRLLGILALCSAAATACYQSNIDFYGVEPHPRFFRQNYSILGITVVADHFCRLIKHKTAVAFYGLGL